MQAGPPAGGGPGAQIEADTRALCGRFPCRMMSAAESARAFDGTLHLHLRCLLSHHACVGAIAIGSVDDLALEDRFVARDFRLGAGRTTTLALPLTSAGRQALRNAQHVEAYLYVALRGAHGERLVALNGVLELVR